MSFKLLVSFLLAAIIGGVIALTSLVFSQTSALQCNSSPVAPGGSVSIEGTIKGFKPEQIEIAETIISIGKTRGLNDRDVVIALMVGIQESRLRNLNYGHLCSLGVFQQQWCQGWGTPKQIMNVEYATNKFYDALENVRGRQGLSLLDVALRVQRPSRAAYLSNDNYFPGWEDEARALLNGSSASSNSSSSADIIAVTNPYCSTGIEAVTVAVISAEGQEGKTFSKDVNVPASAPKGTDLMVWAYQQAGVLIEHNATDQLTQGISVDNRDDLVRGDLIYYGQTPSRVDTVAMYLNESTVLEVTAQQKVRKTELNWVNYIGAVRPVPVPFMALPISSGNGSGGWTIPLQGTYEITSRYGMRRHPYTGVVKLHDGVDLGAANGRAIKAAAAGTIKTMVKSNVGYGWHIIISHGDGSVTTLYGHMSSFANGIAVGKTVSAGTIIGYVGSTGYSTGSHLHFTVFIGGKPTDPVPFMRNHGVAIT